VPADAGRVSPANAVAATSAGIVLYRHRDGAVRVLLAHPGGPFWRGRDEGAWTIPKGLVEPGENPQATARREFEEEMGAMPAGELRPLARIRQRGGKWVEAFALEGDFEVTALRSNSFALEWPPHSGRMAEFPEVDRAEWFAPDEARRKILASQEPLIDALVELLDQAAGSA
jgi:predicted NUDIX family NTP pyrophosphohydrolase